MSNELVFVPQSLASWWQTARHYYFSFELTVYPSMGRNGFYMRTFTLGEPSCNESKGEIVSFPSDFEHS